MDLIRYSTMNMSSINQTTEKIIDVKRRLGRYVRDIDKAQEILLRIAADKKKKEGHLEHIKIVRFGVDLIADALKLNLLFYYIH